MGRRKILCVLSILLVIFAEDTRGQQGYQFSQYMFNGLLINPAYAGIEKAPSVTFAARSQWKGVDGAPTTQTLSAHTLFSAVNVGAGINLINDKIGIHKNQLLSIALSYHLKLGGTAAFSFGLQGGYTHRRSDFTVLGNAFKDPRVANADFAQNTLDIGAGIFFRSRRLDLGLSAPHLLPGKLQYNDTLQISLNRREGFFFFKLRHDASSSIRLEPGFLLKYFKGVPFSFDVNVNTVLREVLTLGVCYRRNESVDFLLRAQVTRHLQVGYAYDYLVGRLSTLSGASHELSVNYQLKPVRHNASSPR